jgi:hypothetical protein
MITAIDIENSNGDSLYLDLKTSEKDEDIIIFNITGLGPPKATVNATGGLLLDGSDVNSVRTDARHIVLTLTVTASGDAEETAKANIYNVFQIKDLIKLTAWTDGLAASVYEDAYVESVEANQFAKVENFVISLYCPYPYWTSNSSEFKVVAETGTDVPNKGTLPVGCWLVVPFTGSVTGDITITNSKGLQEIVFDLSEVDDKVSGGLPTANGDTLTIRTAAGEKRAYYTRSSTEYDVINGIGINDDWIQLHLGDNPFDWEATGGESNMTLRVDHTPIFGGI